MKKTRICKLSDGVAFLKGRYRLLDSGRVWVTPSSNKATIRMKRRLRKLGKKVDNGAAEYWDIFLMYYSWRQNFIKRFRAFRRVQSVDSTFWEALKTHHLSDNPPTLNVDNRPRYPYKKIGLTEDDRNEIIIILSNRDLNYYKEYESGYCYAGGYIK